VVVLLVLIQLGSRDSDLFIERDEFSPRLSLFLQEHLNTILEDLDVSSWEDSVRISKETENIISQLADKEKELQYAPKYKKTERKVYSAYKRHWNKCVNEW
jgi:hypothetical protein